MMDSIRIEGVLMKAFLTKKKEMMIKVLNQHGNIITFLAASSKGQDTALKLPFPAVVSVIARNVNEIFSDFGDKMYRVECADVAALPGGSKA